MKSNWHKFCTYDMMKNRIFLLLFLLVIGGIYSNDYEYKKYTFYNKGPVIAHVLKIKKGIYQPNIYFVNDPYVESLSKIMQRTKADLGINGGFFGRENNETLGILSIYGNILSRKGFYNRGSILINNNGTLDIEKIKKQNFNTDLAKKYRAILSVGDILLRNGIIIAKKGKKNPMSAIGISKDCIYLVVVEGRSLISWGIDEYNLGKFLKKLGCLSGIALDGGGSSELIISNNENTTIKNKLSDGSERKIKTAILFFKKGIIKITLPPMVSKTFLNPIEKRLWKEYRIISISHRAQKSILINYKGKEYKVFFSTFTDKKDTYVLKCTEWKTLFNNLNNYIINDLSIRGLKPNKDAIVEISNGFSKFSLLNNFKNDYYVTTTTEEIVKDKKLLNFLIFEIINDIIEKKE